MTQTPNAVVWIEIPVQNLAKGQAFYEAVLAKTLTAEQMGPAMTAVFPYDEAGHGVSGHLYEGPTAGDGRGPAVSLAVTDPLAEVMGRVGEAGGQVISDVVTIPAGQFFYAMDPDGNRLSFFKV